jgi:hypothetical protein
MQTPQPEAVAMGPDFLSAFILTGMNGYGRDVDPLLGAVAQETWGEEILFDAVKDLPHGALQKRDEEGELLFEVDREWRSKAAWGGAASPLPWWTPLARSARA